MAVESHRCWAEIDRSALVHNARVARQRFSPGMQLLGVVKANAYGHGLPAVAHALSDEADLFGVANVTEAIEARRAVDHPLVILGPALPEERGEIVARGFIPFISTLEEARGYSEEASDERKVRVGFKIDTGMGRMGFPEDNALEMLKAVAALPGVEIHSVATHLPASDEDRAFTEHQLARFRQIVAQLRREVPGDYKVHASPSAGVLGYEQTGFDIVRSGLMLYGESPLPECRHELRPVMTLKAHIVLLRDLPAGKSISYGRTFVTERPTRVATLSIGYADGFPRSLSNHGASVLIRGQRCPVLGRVTMDLTMVDVSALPAVELGDEAVLFGKQGRERIYASEVAQRADTIVWEVFCGIGTRVARVYL